MGVEEKVNAAANGLTEEQKERILSEVEKEFSSVQLFYFYRASLEENSEYFRQLAALSLPVIHNYLGQRAVDLFEYALEADFEDVRIIAADNLDALLEIFPEDALRLYKTAMEESQIPGVRANAAKRLGFLLAKYPSDAIKLYEKASKDPNPSVRANLVTALIPLAETEPEYALLLYSNALDDWEHDVCVSALHSIPALATKRREEAIAFFEKQISSEHDSERYLAYANVLPLLTYVIRERALGFIKRALEDPSQKVRSTTYSMLYFFARMIPSKSGEIVELSRSSQYEDVQLNSARLEERIKTQDHTTAKTLMEKYTVEELADLPIEEATSVLFQDRRQEPLLEKFSPKKHHEARNEYSRKMFLLVLGFPGGDPFKGMLDFLSRKSERGSGEGPETKFLIAYLNSKYVHQSADPSKPLRSEQNITEELKKFVQKTNWDFEKLKSAVEDGGARNLAEIVEYSAFLPDYSLRSFHGEGSYKRVYCAEHKELPGMKLAFLVTDLLNVSEKGKEYLARLNRTALENCRYEASRLALFNFLRNKHLPLILSPPQYDEFSGLYVWTEEFVEEKLSDRVQNGTIKKRDALIFMKQVTSALDAVHSKLRYFHGDLNFDNIGVAYESDLSGNTEPVAKVLDWGLCSSIPDTAYEYDQRRFLGFRLTRSPEVYEGAIPTNKADIWSVGVMLHRIVAGEYPFIWSFNGSDEEWHSLDMQEKTKYEMEVKQKVLAHCQTPEVLSRRLSSLSDDPLINDAIVSCLQPDPERRPSAGELEKMLELALKQTVPH